MYPEIEFDILPPHLRNPFLKSGIYSQFTFQILFSEIFNSGFLDPISRNQRIRVLNYNELVVDEENRRCIYCEDKWCLGHKCEDPYLILFNPYDRDDEYVETQEEMVGEFEFFPSADRINEGDIENEIGKELEELKDSMIFDKNLGQELEQEVEKKLSKDFVCQFVEEEMKEQRSGLANEEYYVAEKGEGESEKLVVEEVSMFERFKLFDEKPRYKREQVVLVAEMDNMEKTEQLQKEAQQFICGSGVEDELEKNSKSSFCDGHVVDVGLVFSEILEKEEFLLSRLEPKELSFADIASSFQKCHENASFYDNNLVTKGLKGDNIVVSKMGLESGWIYFILEQFWKAKSEQNVFIRFSFDPGGKWHTHWNSLSVQKLRFKGFHRFSDAFWKGGVVPNYPRNCTLDALSDSEEAHLQSSEPWLQLLRDLMAFREQALCLILDLSCTFFVQRAGELDLLDRLSDTHPAFYSVLESNLVFVGVVGLRDHTVEECLIVRSGCASRRFVNQLLQMGEEVLLLWVCSECIEEFDPCKLLFGLQIGFGIILFSFNQMFRLRKLDLSETSIKSLRFLFKLINLGYLLQKDCAQLKELPEIEFHSLLKLEELNTSDDKVLENIEANFFHGTISLHILDLYKILVEELPSFHA